MRFLSLALLATLAACADSAGTTTDTSGATGLGQGGAQDFGLFRQILEDGEIPHPDTLDDMGFFAEHKLDYPAPNCGKDVCIHALGGAMNNMISGSTCTIVQLGLNTPINPATLQRPPLDLVLAIDVSGSMAGVPISAVRSGLSAMLPHLDAGDRVTIVAYDDEAEIVATDLDAVADVVALDQVITRLEPGGATNIYDGLFVAFDHAAAQREPGREARVVLLSDGAATAGLVAAERMHALAAAYAREGIGLTTIGIGKDFDVDVMRGLAEVGAGNFYFLEDPAAAREVFTEEVASFLHPVALDVEIAFSTGVAYTARRFYGTRNFEAGMGGGTIHIPALFIAGRRSSQAPIDDGRRGGGGAILIELLPRAANELTNLRLAGEDLGHVGNVAISWTDPVTRQRLQSTTTITSPHAPDTVPVEGWFTDPTVEKGFVMLNVFAGFELAANLALDRDPGAARGVLSELASSVASWLDANPDPDIDDDLTYIDLFIANLETVANQTPLARPPEPWPAD